MISSDKAKAAVLKLVPNDETAEETRSESPGKGIAESPAALRTYLEQHGVKVKTSKRDAKGSTILVLDGCPMNPDHGHGSDTAVILRDNGVIGFECKHNSCESYTWSDVRAKVDPERKRPSKAAKNQAEKLVALADSAGLFHCDDVTYASVPVGDHRETWRVHGGGFRLWLTRAFYNESGKPPGTQALQDALSVLAARALFDGGDQQVAVRLAEHEGAIYLDLGDAQWRAVEITPKGWSIVDRPPVRFIRSRGMRPLPAPVSGTSIDELRPFVNVATDEDWALVLAWLVACLRPSGPFPVLAINGEQGSAKSTLSRLLRALIDPNGAPLRAEPREGRDLMIAATNSWLVALDNLSSIRPWLSDALCRLSTGGGFSVRELYSDDEEKLFDAVRPVLLNGISEFATRPDLLDRAIQLRLPALSESARRTEAELWRDFNDAQPGILGALLDAVSVGLRNLPEVALAHSPRMADFARWAVACEPALGLADGAILAAYGQNRQGATDLAIEASPVGPALVALVQQHRRWEGNYAELLAELNRGLSEADRDPRFWPRNATGMSGALTRIAPALRGMGIEIHVSDQRTRKGRIVTLASRKQGAETVTTVTPSPNPPDAAKNAVSKDDSVTVGDGPVTVGADQPSPEGTLFGPLAQVTQ